MEVREILGLDVGMKRTGIARASNVARLAEPLVTVPTKDTAKKLAELNKAGQVEAVAIGLPRNLKNEDTDQTKWVRQWVDELKNKTDLPLYWQDEALSTVEAEAAKGVKKGDKDSLSAAVILQDFLNTPEAGRVMC